MFSIINSQLEFKQLLYVFEYIISNEISENTTVSYMTCQVYCHSKSQQLDTA